MDDIKPFSRLPIYKYFQHDLEKIKMAYRLSDTILKDLKNIRASGDEVELAVKNFFVDKLFPKYHVCDGHIVDNTLKVSPQFDVIICENSKNPILFNLADKSEVVYYESVYCFGEVKKSFYDKNIIEEFAENIKRCKAELTRKEIAPNFIECANSGFHIEEPVTDLPFRNTLLSFLFFVDTRSVKSSAINETINKIGNKNLPNFIVFLDQGIILNVNKAAFNDRRIKINLYPEFEKEENIWVLMHMQNENDVLAYQYLLILEHLNNTIVSVPNLREYTKNIFDFSFSNFHPL